MPQSITFTAVVAVLAAVTAILSVTVSGLLQRRLTRLYDSELRWLRERNALDLIAVSEYADTYAKQGIEQPGTQAVRTLYPGFDFTMGGKFDDRPLRDTENVVYAPWTPEQVANMAEYQDSGTTQPYTCDLVPGHGRLAPTEAGWTCRVCAYTQPWTFRHVADGSWRTDREHRRGAFAPSPPRGTNALLPRRLWLGFRRRGQ